MRTLATALFWMGRLEIVTFAVLLAHSLIIWRWRRNAAKRWLAVGWFVLFIALSVALFPGLLSRATRGTGYVVAHLHGGIWHSGEEALSNILLRWRNVWLPIYVPWLGAWLFGLISIQLLSVAKQRSVANSN